MAGSQEPGVCVGQAAEGTHLRSQAPASQCWERPLDGAGESAVRESPSARTEFAHSQADGAVKEEFPDSPLE